MFLRHPFSSLSALVLVAALCLSVSSALPKDRELAERAQAAIERAAGFFAGELSLHGAYVWAYSADGKARQGEGSVGETIGWAEPPGTPAIGAAFLELYGLTGNDVWLHAAQEVGGALIRTQLLSGGWYNAMEMDPAAQRHWCYRAEGMTPDACRAIEDNDAKNRALLDDDTTQSGLRFLIWLDRALDGHDAAVRDAIVYGMKELAAAQYPNGAWPVMLDRRVKPDRIPPAGTAQLPESWSREWVKPSGGPYYILNDNVIRDTVHLHFVAAERFPGEAFAEAAIRAGEFLLSAQLPEPQRGWAQTYDSAMQPVWGRKFEPPAIASLETAGAMTALVEIYQHTGDSRFLTAAEEAARWLKSVRLPDGDWARFYELATNRPLYVDQDEKLTYEASDLLDHYNLKSIADIPQAIALVEAASSGRKAVFPFWPSSADHLDESEIEARLRRFADGTDGEGRFIEEGWIRSDSFVEAVFMLGRYLE